MKRTRVAAFSKSTARRVYLGDQPDRSLEQQEREAAFFTSLKLRNGTYKMTADHRMDDLNDFVTSLLPRENTLELLDTAVSSGITTVEWYEHLRRAGVPFRLSASDLFFRAELLSWGRHFHLLVDERGSAMQYETAGLAWRSWASRQDWRSLYVVALSGVRLLFRLLKLAQAPRRQPLRLFSPRLLAVADIALFEDDIFEANDALARRFDVIRAANILNASYFSREKLEQAVRSLAGRLKTGGLLIINRTDVDGVNRGSVFRLTPAGTFSVEGRIGGGYEIEDLVLSFGCPSVDR